MDVLQTVITRPMTQTEVVVAVLELGYRSTMSKVNLGIHVGRELQRGPFEKNGEKIRKFFSPD